MNSLRQFGTGVLLAVLSVFLLIGGFTMAMAEGRGAVSSEPTATYVLIIPVDSPTQPEVPTDAATSLPVETATQTAVPDLPLVIPTFLSPPAASPTTFFPTMINPTALYPTSMAICPVPFGYSAITVKTYDTISSLALIYNMTPAAIMQVNCLTSEQIRVGQLLYVLPKAVATYSVPPTQCGAPYGWVYYSVLSGETLYSLSLRYRVTVAQLKSANCLGFSDYIQAGQNLKVPNVATSTPQVAPTAVITSTPHPSSTLTASQTPIPPTLAPTNTSIPTTVVPPTAEPTAAPTANPTVMPSNTPVVELPTSTSTTP